MEQEQAWGKPKSSTPSEIVQASAQTVQAPAPQVVPAPQPHESGTTLELSIRNACPKTIRRVEINRIGGNGLVVRFVVETEIHAQEAATAIAELPELKAFDVRYEALLLAK